MYRRKSIVEKIILLYPMLYGLQDAIEREQDTLIADMISPAEKVVKNLIALDNRRIDICNLKVLYGFMERGLGEKFGLLVACVMSGADTRLTDEAFSHLEIAGYTVERANEEFSYLFKLVKKPRIKKNTLFATESIGDTIGNTAAV